jgi:uncharacterized small protein (DUF1192 family)
MGPQQQQQQLQELSNRVAGLQVDVERHKAEAAQLRVSACYF